MNVAPFSEFLTTHRKGRLHAELSDALNELGAAVMAVGKAGELILKVKITPATKLDGSAVIIADDVTLKLPTPDRPTGLWFVDDDHNLARDDPRQTALPLHGVDSGEQDATQPLEAAR